MSKTGVWTTIVLAAMIGAHEAVAQTPIPPSPKDFVLAASQSDHYEVLAANVAVVQGHDPRVKTFAEVMIRDHIRLAEALHEAAVAAGLPAPQSGMSSDQALLLSGLQSLRGPDFDRAYARQQELAHTQAIAVEDSFATAGSEPDLQKAARTALSIIRDHLTMARQLRADLGGT